MFCMIDDHQRGILFLAKVSLKQSREWPQCRWRLVTWQNEESFCICRSSSKNRFSWRTALSSKDPPSGQRQILLSWLHKGSVWYLELFDSSPLRLWSKLRSLQNPKVAVRSAHTWFSEPACVVFIPAWDFRCSRSSASRSARWSSRTQSVEVLVAPIKHNTNLAWNHLLPRYPGWCKIRCSALHRSHCKWVVQ